MRVASRHRWHARGGVLANAPGRCGEYAADRTSVSVLARPNFIDPVTGESVPNKNLAAALGVLTGLVGLIGMVRLVSGAFNHGMTTFAWAAILLAMLPWIGYAAWRARHGHLSQRGALTVLLLDLVGCVVVWLFVLGPVVALTCSLAAFAVIWVSDWPPRRLTGEERFVRIEELHQADDT